MAQESNTQIKRRRSGGSSRRSSKENTQENAQTQDLPEVSFAADRAELDQAVNKTLSWTSAVESIDELKSLANTSDNKFVQSFIKDAESLDDVAFQVQQGRQALSAASKTDKENSPEALTALAEQDNPYAKTLAEGFQSQVQQETLSKAYQELESEVNTLSPVAESRTELAEAIEKVSKWEAAGLSPDEMKLLNEKLDNAYITQIIEAPSVSEALQEAKVTASALDSGVNAKGIGENDLTALDHLSEKGNQIAERVSDEISTNNYSQAYAKAESALGAEMEKGLESFQKSQVDAISSANFLAAKEELNEALADIQNVNLTYNFKDGTSVDHVVTYDAHQTTEKQALAEAIVDMSQAYQAVGQTVQELDTISVQSSQGTDYNLSKEDVSSLKATIKEVEQITNFQVATQEHNADTMGGFLDVTRNALADSQPSWRDQLQELGASSSNTISSDWSSVNEQNSTETQFRAIPVVELLKEELTSAGMDLDTINKSDAIAQALNMEREGITSETFLMVHSTGPAIAVLTDQEGVDRKAREGDLVMDGALVQSMLNGIDRSVKEFKDELPTITEGMTTLDVYSQLTDNTIARLEKEGVPSELMEALANTADKAQINVGAAPDAVLTETFVADQINSKWGEGLSDAQVLRESAQDLPTLQEAALNKGLTSSNALETDTDMSTSRKDNDYDKDREEEERKRLQSRSREDDREPETQKEAEHEMEMAAE